MGRVPEGAVPGEGVPEGAVPGEGEQGRRGSGPGRSPGILPAALSVILQSLQSGDVPQVTSSHFPFQYTSPTPDVSLERPPGWLSSAAHSGHESVAVAQAGSLRPVPERFVPQKETCPHQQSPHSSLPVLRLDPKQVFRPS